MKLRRRRLRSPSLRAARHRERSNLAGREAHRAHVAAYPGAYDSATIALASSPSKGPDRHTPEGSALGLVADHGATRAGLRAALDRIAVDHYQAHDPNGGTYPATAFEGPYWDRVRAHLEGWLAEDEEARAPALPLSTAQSGFLIRAGHPTVVETRIYGRGVHRTAASLVRRGLLVLHKLPGPGSEIEWTPKGLELVAELRASL